MSGVPLPGKPVRGSKTGVPLMAALDLIGRRWALQIIWELYRKPLGFRALREACTDISPTILSTRLKELRSASLVEYDGEGRNQLTKIGIELYQAVGSLKSWALRWEKSLIRNN
jgi:DNA-binding HxlR family transcriptional regulator